MFRTQTALPSETSDNPLCYRGFAFEKPLSKYNRAAIDWVLDDTGNAVINAVAGSGKTFTLKAIARVLPSKGIFLAFNKHIQEELAERLRGLPVDVSTVHSVGFRALRSKFGKGMKVESGKYLRLLKALFAAAEEGDCGLILSEPEREALRNEKPMKECRRLLDLLRLDLVPLPPGSSPFVWERDVAPLAERHDLDLHPDLCRFLAWGLARILRQGLEMIRKGEELDFTDMLWGVTALSVRPWSYSWVLCDEAQDLSPAQLAVALACVYRNGRFLAVGDRRQAIYGFAGAASDSIDRIIQTTRAKVLPLNVCYRCPSSHLDLAREIVPEIEAAPWAEKGEIDEVVYSEVGDRIHEGDLVVCRTTAPLIRLCFDLLSRGVSARVRGRDIGEALIEALDEVEGQRGFRFRDFPTFLQKWEDLRTGKVLKRNGGDEEDPAIQAILDQGACLLAFFELARVTTMKALKREVEDLFSDTRPSVWLSSVHRAKGLEGDRVWILRPELLPFPFARKDWQVEQEQNLRYVALTRAKKALFFITTNATKPAEKP